MPARVYAAGRGSDLNALVVWMDPETYAVTSLPAIGVVGQLHTIVVIAEDDIWVGWNATSSQSNYPRLAHWDGVSWTVMELNIFPSNYEYYSVASLIAVSSDEVYAVVGPDHIIKWNGSAWSVHIDTSSMGLSYSLSEYSSILPESTGDDMWLGHIGYGISYVAHWNGSVFDELTALPNSTAGLITYKEEIYAAVRDGVARARIGVGTWVSRFTVPYTFSPEYGHSTWWRDDYEDILWCGSKAYNGVQTGGVTKWDGTTATRYPNTLSTTAQVHDITGISSPGQDAKIFYVWLGGNILRIRESSGTWRNESLPGSYWALDSLQANNFVYQINETLIAVDSPDAPGEPYDAPFKPIQTAYEPVVDLNLVEARLTNRARYYISRGMHDGTGLQPVRFVLGAGWENPRWGEPPKPSPDATEVSNAVYEGAAVTEAANEKTLVIRCEGEAAPDYPVQEVMVYARILNSPFTSESFKEIPFASATFPEWFHTTGQWFVARIVIPM